MSRRMDRVNVLLRDEISKVLATELKNPRLPTLISVTSVDASSDVRFAKVLISVMGNGAEKAAALKALKSASGFIRHRLRKNLRFKHVPSIMFHLDESIERGAEMSTLINQVVPREEAPQ